MDTIHTTNIFQGKLFCFGLGYTAGHLGMRCCAEGMEVQGTCRSEASCMAAALGGFTVHQWEVNGVLWQRALEGVTHLLISIPPDAEGDPVLRQFRDQILTNQTIKWVGYLSSTAVYGDHQGEWVDETTPTNPHSERGEWRVQAENAWLNCYHENEAPVHIFRLSGIYGPERNVLQRILKGTAQRIFKEEQVFSRIHVEDIAQVLMASMLRPTPGEIYNLSDDLPAPGHEVVEYACAQMNVSPPPLQSYETVELSPMAKEFYSANRRVSNEKLKQHLLPTLNYPTYREGINALLATEVPVHITEMV